MIRISFAPKKKLSMPQLDVSTFFSQFFWLSFVFLGFYGILVRLYLPKMSRLLKLRTRKVSGGLETPSKTRDLGTDSFFLDGLRTSSEEVQACTQATATWMQDCIRGAQKTQFQDVNTLYFSTLGQLSAGQNLFAHEFTSLCSPKDFQRLGRELAGPAREKAFTLRVFDTL